MCDEMHPAQDTSAWLILLESSESQLYRGVSHFLRRKFCEKWKLAVWKELLKHFDVRYARSVVKATSLMFAQNLTQEANDKIHTERKRIKKTKVILKETNVKWERRSAGRKVRKRVVWSAFMIHIIIHYTWLNSTDILLLRGKGFPGVIKVCIKAGI